MKVKSIFFLIVVSIFFLQSCGSVMIQSNKQIGYTKHPKKIFILVNSVSNENGLFSAGLVNSLKQQFKLKGVDADTYVKNALSLDTQADIDKKVDLYKPEVVLIITQVLNSENGGAFEVTMRDEETGKNVWKSELGIAASNTYGNDQSSLSGRAAKTIIQKLTNDKIL